MDDLDRVEELVAWLDELSDIERGIARLIFSEDDDDGILDEVGALTDSRNTIRDKIAAMVT